MSERLYEIEATVARGEVPRDLELCEQLFALTINELYKNYNSKALNREQAKRIKKDIYAAYERIKNEFEVTEQHKKIYLRLSRNIGSLYSCGCPNCKKLIDIFTGVDREDIPQDIKECHERNKRLVEVVAQKSDRNAELASTIDRVRFCLDSDRTMEEKLERIKEIVRK